MSKWDKSKAFFNFCLSSRDSLGVSILSERWRTALYRVLLSVDY